MNTSYAMVTSKKRNYYEKLYNKEKYFNKVMAEFWKKVLILCIVSNLFDWFCINEIVLNNNNMYAEYMYTACRMR